MSKTKEHIMQLAACIYPHPEDEQIHSYLFSKQTEDYSQ